MGTRNLTAVYMNGEYKIAQYGQWDGYPEGQGMTCLEFLRDKCDMPRFREAVCNVKSITADEYNKLILPFGMKKDGTISLKDYDRFKGAYPSLHRDMGADILEYVQKGNGAVVHNEIEFAADSLFCEWAWVIDLDANTFEGYEGFNKTPLTPDDRFYFLRDKENRDDDGNVEYHGVKLVAKWSLDDLPTDKDFLAAFSHDGEDEDDGEDDCGA